MADASSRIGSDGQRAQGIPLLRTKLYIPPALPSPVPRLRLTQRLNEGLDRKLILISAPAGFGKSTLLSEWRTIPPTSETPFAWLSLDDADNDLARFWVYFIATLQGIRAGVGDTALPALQSPQPPPMEPILTALINELAAIPDDFILVLDDYHVITNEAIHQSLTFLIEHMPTHMHLVIASRTDPPLPLTLLRGRGQLAELRGDDLRFTPDEIAVFLNQVMGLNLSSDQIAALDERTEGWIVGLQMAAISMQGQDDPSELIAEFSGDDRYILDYLVEQVLDRQMGQVQSFLLQTSILNRMCGPLCEAVTGQEGGQATLETLESANLFIIPLDNRRRWYRYHHLFTDVLGTRLQQTQPDLVSQLHRRAAGWYEENELVEEAVDHALASEDFEDAARLIEEVFPSMRELVTPYYWLEALPEELVRSRPRLSICYAFVLSQTTQDHDLMESLLQDAERVLSGAEENAENQQMLGEVAAGRVQIAAFRGDLRSTIELASQARALLPGDSLDMLDVGVTVGRAYLATGDVLAAEREFAELARHVDVVDFAPGSWSFMQVERGHLRQAAEALSRRADRPVEPSKIASSSGGMLVLLALIDYEWNDLDAAEKHLLQGIEIGHQWNSLDRLRMGYSTLARVYQVQGDMERATDTMQEAMQWAPRLASESTPQVWGPEQVGALQAQLWLMQGNLDAASRWAHESGLSVEDEPGHRRLTMHLTLARLHIMQGRSDIVLPLLERLDQQAEAQGRVKDAIEIKAVQAVAQQAQGDIEQAVATMERALTIAEPEGYIRTFVDEGEPMAKLLSRAASQGIAPQYVAKLLAAFDGATEPVSPASQPLLEPLSEREIEVLRLITAGLSNQEIADELVVGVSTVKKHINNIYGKLGAHSRTQAIALVRDLDLET